MVNSLPRKPIILYGSNSYSKDLDLRQIQKIAVDNGFQVERYDGADVEIADLINLISGVSLLSEKRFIIVKNISENTATWSKLPGLLTNWAGDIILVIVEDKLDKRLKSFKELSKVAEIREFKELSTKDEGLLVEKIQKLTAEHGMRASPKEAKALVDWVGLDEWRLKSAIERLVLVEDFSESAIKKYIPRSAEDNIFDIFESALRGKADEVSSALNTLKSSGTTDEAYQFFGLISSQLFNLISLKVGHNEAKTTDQIAKTIKANAWALSKLDSLAVLTSVEELKDLNIKFVRTDEAIKESGIAPWDLIESLLIGLAYSKYTSRQ